MTCVYRYTDLDDAIAIANALPVAFQASIFAHDLDVALRAAERLDASAVMINDLTAFRTDWMPFAGRRQSGYGVGGIPYTMRDMTQEKMIVSCGSITKKKAGASSKERMARTKACKEEEAAIQ